MRTQLDNGSNIVDPVTQEAYELNVPADQILQLFADNRAIDDIVGEYARQNLLSILTAKEDVLLFLRIATDLGWLHPDRSSDLIDELSDGVSADHEAEHL